MTYLKEAAKRIYRIVFMPRLQSEISHLSSAGPVSQSLVNALRATLKNDATPEEKVWIDKIESLRKELSSSSRELRVIDYGAGTPHYSLSEEQMRQGRSSTQTIGAICRNASKSPFWSYLLFRLVIEFRPSVCLELGTCLGISGC